MGEISSGPQVENSLARGWVLHSLTPVLLRHMKELM